LAALGRKLDLKNEDVEALERVRDGEPAKPMSFR
jgi:plasmid stability protein